MRYLLLLLFVSSNAMSQPFSGPGIIGTEYTSVRNLGVAASAGNAGVAATVYPGEVIVVLSAYDSNVVPNNPTFDAPTSDNGKIDITNRIGTTAANVSCYIGHINPTKFFVVGTVAVTFNSSPGACAMSAYAVMNLSTNMDTFSTNSGSSTTPTSNAATLSSVANEFLIAVVAIEGPNTDAAGIWTSVVRQGNRAGTNSGGAAANCTIDDAYLILASPGRSNVGSMSGITSRDWAAAVATYKFR